MLRRVTAATVLPLVALATACATVATVRRPAQFIASKAPQVVLVTAAGNSKTTLLSPRVNADTIAGLADGVHYVEIPLSSVQSMRARQFAPRRTALLIGGLTTAIGVLALSLHGGSSAVQPVATCATAESCEE